MATKKISNLKNFDKLILQTKKRILFRIFQKNKKSKAGDLIQKNELIVLANDKNGFSIFNLKNKSFLSLSAKEIKKLQEIEKLINPLWTSSQK